jgi:hypothetical protein
MSGDMSIATALKIVGGLVFASAAFSIVACSRCGLVRRGLDRPNGRRPGTEEAQALARGADEATAIAGGTRTAASDRCVLEAQARSIAHTN